MKQIVGLLVAASAALFAFIFGNEADEFPLADLVILLAAFVAVLAVQGLALGALEKILHRIGLGDRRLLAIQGLAAIFVAANAYFMAFMTYDAPLWVQVAMSVAAGAIILLVMLVRRLQPFTLFVLSAYFVMSVGLYGYTRISMHLRSYESDTTLTVNSRRNVYLIGNESLHSPNAFRSVYGIDDLPHVDYLRTNGFRVLDRSYSTDRQTLESFSRMLEFSQEVDHSDIMQRYVFKSLNSTIKAFSSGGYRSQVIYRYSYFGMNTDLVDFSYPGTTHFHCGFVPAGFFYGLCTHPMRIRINKYLFGTPYRLDLDRVEERIRVASNSEDPWLTIYHHSFPFHTRMAHRYTDEEAVQVFRGRVTRAVPRILEMGMERIVGTILREDPDAIIVLFGDHGTGLTRDLQLDEANDRYSPGQILEDRYGVMVAVYPRNFCTNRIFDGSTTTYLLESVIQCLNGDDSPTPEQRARSRIIYEDDERRDVAQYVALPTTGDEGASPADRSPRPEQ